MAPNRSSYAAPSETSERAGRFFNNFASRFDSIYDGKRNAAMRWLDWQFRRDMFERFDLTFAFLGDLKGGSLLDIGCGSGPYLAEAFRRGLDRAVGLDPAPEMLKLAAQRLEPLGATARAHFLEGYFPGAPLAEKFDFAIAIGVLDYVPDAATFVREVHQRVTKGAVLSFPSKHWWRTPVRKFRYRMRNCPVYFYSEADIRGLLQRAGVMKFKIQKIRGAGLDFVVWLDASR